MKKIGQEFMWFLRQKIYVALLSLAAVCSYGFEITHHSIGTDDTAVSLYFEEGLSVAVGRWVLFLLNKVFSLADFAPFLLEFAGVLLLLAGVTLFCVLLRRILGDGAGIAPYVIFACVFVTNPIIAEVYYYYAHNGVELGYIFTALSLLFYLEAMEGKGWGRLKRLLASAGCIWVAMGCYESFLILYLVGVTAVLFLRGMTGRDRLTFLHLFRHLSAAALLLAVCVILRSFNTVFLVRLFGLEELQQIAQPRSMTEMLELFVTPEGRSDLAMLLKRYFLVYYLNAVVYLPVTGYVISSAVTGVMAAVLTWKKRNAWYLMLFAGMQLIPVLMTVIGTELTKYRTCQFLPFVCGLGLCLLYLGAAVWKGGKLWRAGAGVAAFVLILNQASRMNAYFYQEYLKYEDARETMLSIAYEVERLYGKETPVIFTGKHYTPHAFAEDYFVGYDSWQYRVIAALSDPVDEHLKEKYFSEYGYRFGCEGELSVIDWGVTAFDGTNRELMRFLEMHGHSFPLVTDREVLARAAQAGYDMPCWPREGSVIAWNGYVLVHIDR